MYFYQAYGLNIASEFYLPELIVGGDGSDLAIARGKIELPELTPTIIKRQGLESWFGGTVDNACMYWGKLGKFLAQEGKRLIVDPDREDIPYEFLNLYILSEALGMILYQKGLFLLHASAIQVGNEVIVVIGNPGAGKSTTAAAFALRSHTVLTDDMVAIEVTKDSIPRVVPGFPQIKIWPPSVAGLGYDPNSLPVLFPGSTKRVIRQQQNFPTKSFPLKQIFFLSRGDKFNVYPLDKAEALLAFTRYFPCPYDLLQKKAHQRHFIQCSRLLKQIPVSKVERPDSFEVLNQWIDSIYLSFSIEH